MSLLRTHQTIVQSHLQSVFSKLMERCIVIEMLSYLSSRNLISKQQHGFLKKKSTTTNLVESFNDWSINIEGRTSQTIASIDFAKAFDSVCHSKLLYKLSQYGICGPLLNLIESFLSGVRTVHELVMTCPTLHTYPVVSSKAVVWALFYLCCLLMICVMFLLIQLL